MEKAKVTELLANDGSNTTGAIIETPPWRDSGTACVMAALAGTGTFASDVEVQGSHDAVNWVAVIQMSLDNTTAASYEALTSPWPFLRVVTSNGSGTPSELRVTLAQ